jgi:hypothetical protein
MNVTHTELFLLLAGLGAGIFLSFAVNAAFTLIIQPRAERRWTELLGGRDRLVCPNCGSGDVEVWRDGKATRECRKCGRDWLPDNDPPEAGGPYIGISVKIRRHIVTRWERDPTRRGAPAAPAATESPGAACPHKTPPPTTDSQRG